MGIKEKSKLYEGKGVLEHPFRYSLVNLRLIYATRPTSGCENND